MAKTKVTRVAVRKQRVAKMEREIAVLTKVLRILAPLDDEQRRRVVEEVARKLAESPR